jgi:hypothetical protein
MHRKEKIMAERKRRRSTATSWKSQQEDGRFYLQFETSDKKRYESVERASQLVVDGKDSSNIVEVTRCKDCKNARYTTNFYIICGRYNSIMQEMDFCSRGEKAVRSDC